MTRRTRSLAATATLLSVALFAWTAPASAEITHRGGAMSAYDSLSPKVANTSCVDALHKDAVPMTAGGLVSDPTSGRLHLTGLVPVGPDAAHGANNVYAWGEEIGGGTAAEWAVGTYHFCGPEPAGLTYIEAASATDSTPAKWAAAFCPGKTRVLGTGARIVGGHGEVYLSGIVPSPDLTHVVVTAHEDASGYAGLWRVHAYAVCALPLPHQQFVEASSPMDSSSTRRVDIECPPGDHVHGLGFAVTAVEGYTDGEPTRGQSEAMDVLLTYLGGSTHIPGSGDYRMMRAEAVEAAGGTVLNWKLWAFAVCAIGESPSLRG